MRLVVAAVAGALLLSGCGGGGDLSDAAAQRLSGDVDRVEAAARADDAAGLQDALVALRRDVEQLEQAGEVSPSRAARILAAAARVATDVGPPAPQVVVSVAPAPPPPAAERGGGGAGRDDKAEQAAEKAREKAEKDAEDERKDDEGEDDD